MKKLPLLFLFCCLQVIHIRAATFTVQMLSGNTFSPSTLTIGKGDSVTWTNADFITHTATSGSGCTQNTNWNTGSVSSHATKTITFNMLNAGTYTYFCIPHCPSMAATLVITNPPNQSPSVTLTNPANNAVFPANTTVQLGAMASDSDGTITNVSFLVGGVAFTNRSSAPYLAATNLPAGSYIVSAIASDNSGAKATNSVSITINAPPTISFTPGGGTYSVSEGNQLTLTVTGTDTDALTITSTNLPSGATLTGTGNARTFSWTPNYGQSYGSPYAISFIANDSINSPVTTFATVTVNPVLTPVNITGSVRVSNQFQFNVSGLRLTRTNFVQVSTNLASWTSIRTNIATNTSFVFTDTNAVTTRMYRVLEVR